MSSTEVMRCMCFVCFVQCDPPLKPPRGEVNAADAFDIGSFDEDDVKGIKVIVSLRKLLSGYYRHLTSHPLAATYDV